MTEEEILKEAISPNSKIDLQKIMALYKKTRPGDAKEAAKRDRELEVYKMRVVHDMTLAQIAKELNLSVQRVRQIEAKAQTRFRKITDKLKENFLDGKNPQDKGDSRRHGIPKNATIAQLKKIRSSDSASPRKKQLAHWQINMRQGKKKTNEESPATSIGNQSVALPPTARFKTIDVTDKRYRKDKMPVLLKRFRKHYEDNA